MQFFARTTSQGTAAAETAVCETHRDLSQIAPDADGPLVDATGNEALSCQVCGVQA